MMQYEAQGYDSHTGQVAKGAKVALRELRLVPAAVVMWAASLAIIVEADLVALLVVAASVAAAWALRQRGQAVLVAAAGLAGIILSATRRAQAAAFEYPMHIVGALVGDPRQVTGGGWLIRLRVEGLPDPLTVFLDEAPEAPAGARVAVKALYSDATKPGIIPVTGNGEILSMEPPTGMAAWTHRVAENFRNTVETTAGESSRGLIPGMVLGDTSLQTEAEQQLYVETGLSHLSAVSGANVAIVCAAAVICCRAMTLGPRTQVAAAAAMLGLFVALVGMEPSVLRASATGIVGLLAVVGSRKMEPFHALSLAIIACLTVSSGLAANFAFALSCAATASIVALTPLLYRVLAPLGLPDIATRALAVSVAADLMTMPLIALMTGEVSVVSVLANVLVGPATAPVTIMGLIAAAAAQLPGPLAPFLITLMEPFTWWIHHVATGARALPVVLIPAHPVVVLIAYGWILAGFLAGRARLTMAVTLASFAAVAVLHIEHSGQPVDVHHLRRHVVATEESIDPIPEGTQVIIVLETGRPRDRPTRTASGIPVLYPNRDGQVTLYSDGTQHAADGRF